MLRLSARMQTAEQTSAVTAAVPVSLRACSWFIKKSTRGRPVGVSDLRKPFTVVLGGFLLQVCCGFSVVSLTHHTATLPSP